MLKKLIIILSVILLSVILFLGFIYSLAYPPLRGGLIPAEEFNAIINSFANNGELIQEQVDFTIDTRSYYNVYRLADADVDTAVRIFNHPDYPNLVVNGDMSKLEEIIGEGTICYYFNDNYEIDCVNGIDEYVREILIDLARWIF